MISFYRPSAKRWKIVIEKGAFPSDWVSTPLPSLLLHSGSQLHQYAVHSHPAIHSDILSKAQIDNAVIAISPRKDEYHLREEDILAKITEGGDEVNFSPCESVSCRCES
jgi:kynureninase